MSAQRPVEAWCDALLASPLSDADKVAGIAMSRFADWESGRGVRPGMATVAERIHRSRTRTTRAVGRLVAAGWLARTGYGPRGVVEYRLIMPADGRDAVTSDAHRDSGEPVRCDAAVIPGTSGEPVSCDAAVTPEPPEHLSGVTPVASGVTPVAFSCDATVTQPPQYLSERSEERDEEEDQTAPGPRASAALRPGPDGGNKQRRQGSPAAEPAEPDFRAPEIQAAARAVIRAVIGPSGPRPWRNVKVPVDRIAPAVGPLLAAGWTVADLCAHAQTVGRARSNNAGLLAAHLSKLADQDPATWREFNAPPQSDAERVAASQFECIGHLLDTLPKEFASRWDLEDTDRPLLRGTALARSAEMDAALKLVREAEAAGFDPLALSWPPNEWESGACHACAEPVINMIERTSAGYRWTCPEHTGAHGGPPGQGICPQCRTPDHPGWTCDGMPDAAPQPQPQPQPVDQCATHDVPLQDNGACLSCLLFDAGVPA